MELPPGSMVVQVILTPEGLLTVNGNTNPKDRIFLLQLGLQRETNEILNPKEKKKVIPAKIIPIMNPRDGRS